jgi:hypothetical protein
MRRQAVSKTQSGVNGQGGLKSIVPGKRTMSGSLVASVRSLEVAIFSNGSLQSVFRLRELRETVSRVLSQRVRSGLTGFVPSL